MNAQQVYQFRGLIRNRSITFGKICDRTQIDMKALFALLHYLASKAASKAARYWNRNLCKLTTAAEIKAHFEAKAQ